MKRTEMRLGRKKSGGMDGAGGRRERGQSVAMKQEQFSARLRRLNVQDYQTGLTLFEHVWSWRGNRSTDGVDALVTTFYQFASSIDKNNVGVSRVLFELPQVQRQTRGRQTARMNQKRLRAGLTMAPAEIMEMICGVNEKVRVVLFHDVTRGGDIEKVDDLVLGLLQKFTDTYGKSLAGSELRDLLTEVYQSNPSEERNEKYAAIHDQFKVFKDDVLASVELIGQRPAVHTQSNKFLEGGGLKRVGSSTGNILNTQVASHGGGGVNAQSVMLSMEAGASKQ